MGWGASWVLTYILPVSDSRHPHSHSTNCQHKTQGHQGGKQHFGAPAALSISTARGIVRVCWKAAPARGSPTPSLSALSFGCSSQLSFAKDHSEPRISNTRTWPSLYSRLEILKWPALAVGKGSAASPPLASRSRDCENQLSISLLHSLLLGSSGSDLGFGLCVVLQVGNLLTCQCPPMLCCPELGLPHSLSLSPLPEVWGPERLCSRSHWR